MIIMNVLREVQLSYLLREKSGPYIVVGKLIVRGLSTAAKFLFSLVAYRYLLDEAAAPSGHCHAVVALK